MTPTPNLVGIVDGYSSGHTLPHWFRAKGYDCVHITSSEFVRKHVGKKFNPSDYLYLLQNTGDPTHVIDALQSLGVRTIVAGSETGVNLADNLSEALEAPTNGTAKTRARRDKAEMGLALEKCGLSSIQGRKAATIEEGVLWAIERNQWPIVVKPVASAGGDCVTLCHEQTQLRDSLAAILGSINKIGLRNEAALLQTFESGDVFSVNTVSCQGRHFVTHIWQYTKAGFVYDCEYIIPNEGQIPETLTAYALRVLDAMGIQYGPAHIEIIHRQQGPVVVDFGARLHGCDSPVICRECTGIGQDELTVDAFVDPADFARKTRSPYRVFKHLMTVDFICPVSGRIASLKPFDQLKQLPSYHRLLLDIDIGDKVVPTTDLFTSPGLIELVHRDRQQLNADYAAIRKLEATSLYAVE